jgi:hypothetical protein
LDKANSFGVWRAVNGEMWIDVTGNKAVTLCRPDHAGAAGEPLCW